MTRPDIHGILSASPDERPAVLEGGWLDLHDPQVTAATNPASILEGDGQALRELPVWLARNTAQFPEGGAIGYLSYELARAFEAVPLPFDPAIPDFSLAYYPEIRRLPSGTADFSHPGPSASSEALQGFDKEHFIADIERIRTYIASGDIYQANLTQRFTARLAGFLPEEIYARLAGDRTPMRAFLKTPRATVISHSPERFFRVRGNRILASPIKGTLARSSNPAEDARGRQRLLASAKDRAENVMIVDLLRNDLGRICRYDSIDSQLWEIQALPHLFHLVSHVKGELKPKAGPDEIIRALFPCGSITGAPKIRAMEILAEIERAPRGISMGAIGIIMGAPGSPEFEMDFNVAIRTITVRDQMAEFNVGSGIVHDSKPEAEYEEMLLKAQPLIEALGLEAPGAVEKKASEPPAVAAMSSSPSSRFKQSRR